MAQFRSGRMANEIQKEVADIIANQVKDPRLGFVSVHSVEVAHDLSAAHIHISALSDDKDAVARALESARGFIRRELGHRIRARIVPELLFSLDDSISYGIRMAGIIDEQLAKDEAQASLRPAEKEESKEEENNG